MMQHLKTNLQHKDGYKPKMSPSPKKIIQPLPLKENKFTTPLAPRKKSQFSQKSTPPPPPSPQKNQPPKSLRSHENYICSLSTLNCNISFV